MTAGPQGQCVSLMYSGILDLANENIHSMQTAKFSFFKYYMIPTSNEFQCMMIHKNSLINLYMDTHYL